MIRGYINNPKQLSKEMQLCIASMAEKQVRIAELGFPLNEKNWCKLTQALELLSDEQQKSIINSYNNLMIE